MNTEVPFRSSQMSVDPGWIDYNGHLNMAFYHVLLDRAGDEFWLTFGLGPHYREATGCSTFAAECHIRYIRELRPNDPVDVSIFLVAFDSKRLHTFRLLRHAVEGWIAAVSENMSLHVDLASRKVTPFPLEMRNQFQRVLEMHRAIGLPDGIGRRISMQKEH